MQEDQIKQVLKEIDDEVKSNKIVLFMKGTKEMPQCGFSARVVQILDSQNVEYATKNVLEDEYLREGIKKYTSWPTIPQLYVNSEFVGGCDIIVQLNDNGELSSILQ